MIDQNKNVANGYFKLDEAGGQVVNHDGLPASTFDLFRSPR